VVNGGYTTLSGVIFHNNSGVNGGGVRAESGSRLSVLDCYFALNTASASGGSIFVAGPNSNIERTIVEYSTAQSGGGIQNRAGGGTPSPTAGLVVVSSTIRNNTGGGIANGRATDGGFVALLGVSDSTIHNNNGIQGAGIWNYGKANVTASIVRDNVASNDGGGLHNRGQMTLLNSTITGNSAVNGGAASSSYGEFARITLTSSTVSGNSASAAGGGFYITNGPMGGGNALVAINSTISGNQATSGGAISVDLTGGGNLGNVKLTNTTVANNTASSGAGIYSIGSGGGPLTPVNARSSIIANNGPNCTLSVPGIASYTLVSDNSCAFSGTGNLNNTPANLGPLGNNGGPTQTQALLPGSAALDGQPTPCDVPVDQRGTARPQGTGCDLGSFELFVTPPPLVAPSNVSAQLASPTSINVVFTDNATDETLIEIERNINNGAFSFLVATNGPLPGAQSGWYYPDSGLGSGLTYCYRLRAKRGAEYSAYSNQSCATTTTPSVAAPSNVSAVPDGASTMNVIFTDNATDETGIEIERKTGVGGIYGVIVSTNSALPGAQSGWYYPDSAGLSASTQYCYRIRTKQGATYSAYSNEACGTTAAGSLPAPSDVRVLNPTASSLNVQFTDNATGEDGIEIERKTGLGGNYALVVTTSALPGAQPGWYWPNSGLDAGTTYCYRLRTKQGATFSAYSAEACGTTAAAATAAQATVAPAGAQLAPLARPGRTPSLDKLPAGTRRIPLDGGPPTAPTMGSKPPAGTKPIPVAPHSRGVATR
jgi:hypothetical protein